MMENKEVALYCIGGMVQYHPSIEALLAAKGRQYKTITTPTGAVALYHKGIGMMVGTIRPSGRAA